MAPPYVSPLREAQAAQTRLRVLEAAASVFGSSGYSGTSLPAIAAEAGVSLETVKQNGPKAALLLASFDQAFSGAEGDGPLHFRELGAQAAALIGVLVRTGKFREDALRDLQRDEFGPVPDYIIDSVADLPALIEAKFTE